MLSNEQTNSTKEGTWNALFSCLSALSMYLFNYFVWPIFLSICLSLYISTKRGRRHKLAIVVIQVIQRLKDRRKEMTAVTRCSCGSRCVGWGVAVALVSGISTVAITVTDVRQRNTVSTLTVQLTHPVTHWITNTHIYSFVKVGAQRTL